ncbi:DUF4270 family protein [Tenacibaculum sp. IB213877]|uniref:DUF4270 family protein n=1 Tax=Tenacibaculum sp. IB213877 TaxID=3097351 RepID=UPI002A59E3C7|nr:DUF4270 family protein [Tenacibaculum sp. IB213877]MDY0780536.1 DUF4270 family protein [Tenacibaculum sp. IB213877]
MIKKIAYLGVIALSFASMISCEKDFRDIGNNVIKNDEFNTNKDTIDIVINPVDVEAVRADNIKLGTLGEYLLGVYKKDGAKKIEASIVSQVGYLSNLKNAEVSTLDSIDSIYRLDKVILKIPYTATSLGDDDNGDPQFRLDSILGNTNIETSLSVYRNGTYLNSLNPEDPSKTNSYLSNTDYIEEEMLNEASSSSFKPNSHSTFFEFERTLSNNITFKDTVTHTNNTPFLVIPLSIDKMKELFWDKFNDPEFESKEAFDDYFRGVILKAEGEDGALVPFSLSGNNNATIEFLYNITRFERETPQAPTVYKDSIISSYSFPLSGVKNSHYKMTNPTSATPTNNFVIQGTAGTVAEIKILDQAKLQELRAKNWLINDALLSFYIDQSSETKDIPLRLFAYKYNEDASDSQIKDSYSESSFFGGNLQYDSDENPEKYEIRIGDYVSDLLSGEKEYNPPLRIKVYNVDTDSPVSNNALDTIVKTYNWNPRSVRLLNHLPANGEKRAKLIISYTEEN